MVKKLPKRTLQQLEADNARLHQRIEELEQIEQRYELAMKGSNEGLWDWNPVSKELILSARLLTTFDISEDETLKTTSTEWLTWVHPDDRQQYQDVLSEHLKGKTKFFDCEYRVRNKQGLYIWVHAHGLALRNEAGVAYRMVGSIGDITERKEHERQLQHQANYDSLTELPNRLLAMDRLSQSLAHAKRNKKQVGVLFIDLDNFKKINDTLGHDIGDHHLIEISHRLKQCTREEDSVARLGGDEFLMILQDIEQIEEVDHVCQRILQVLAKSVSINGYECFTTASIGITLFPNDGDNPQALLRNADTAMYRAKETGKNTYRYFTSEMNQESIARLNMESYLRHALENNELSLHYQAVVDIPTGNIVGAEALLRWNSPQYGTVPPDTFIPLAEESGLIIEFGDWVLETACKQAQKWRQKTGHHFLLAVNVAFPQFRDGHLVKTVHNVLRKTGLPPACLELELTERLLMEDETECAQALKELHDMGVRISIDDFGTGYSSLSYLKRFPVNTLKIDRSFVSNIDDSPENIPLITAIISMSHALGLNVIGEGVETKEQLDFLKDKNCNYAQGYYLYKPMPVEQFDACL